MTAAAPHPRRFITEGSPVVARIIELLAQRQWTTEVTERSSLVDMLYDLRRNPYLAASVRLCETCRRPYRTTRTGIARCPRCTRH